MTDDQPYEDLVFNGINGATGDYLLPPLPAEEIAKIAKGESLDKDHLKELEAAYQEVQSGVKLGVNADPKDLEACGWGVILAAEDEAKVPALKEALGELLQHRKDQAGNRYREFIGTDAYRPGESKSEFLARHGMGPGPADPDVVPYYLLIVAAPETIPYRFQYQLDVQYAVGRIHFDTLEEYAQYARSVVASETGQVELPRQAAFFGVKNSGDRATQLSAEKLVGPLAEKMAGKQSEWKIETFMAEDATKAQLAQLLGGDQTPALLFTASHGMGFPVGDPRQLSHQGALLCQDWPGQGLWSGEIPQEFYFSADDLASDSRLLGMLAFHFACYGAGTPRLDDFAHRAFRQPVAIAPHAFVANLPRRLLGHPNGGALAVVGHVEKAWGYSFLWSSAGPQLKVFEDTLDRLMDGFPVGSAMEWFDERYAELSTLVSEELENLKFGAEPDDRHLAGLWTANNDARSYVIIGDPAVRLPVTESHLGPAVRPIMAPVEIRTVPAPETPPLPPPSESVESVSGAQDDSPGVEGATLGENGPQTSPQPYTISGTVTLQQAGSAAGLVAMPASFSFSEADKVDRAVAYGLFGGNADVSELRDKLLDTAKSFVDRMADAVENAVSDVASLEVLTYTSEDLENINKDDIGASASLRAFTRINPDGDVEVCVPSKDGQVDTDLWALHSGMVQQAQANRAELIRMAIESVGGLLKVI